MSDARWFEIERDVATAAEYLGLAVQLYESRDLEGHSLDAFAFRMGFIHAVQSGHTSVEAALVRILEMWDEQRPTGEHWHSDLIARACQALDGNNARPAILSSNMCQMADETRRFRNLAVRGYERFSASDASDTVAAARFVSEHLAAEIAEFKNVIDPD